MDAVGKGTDFSQDPAFIGAMTNKIYFGPVYLRRGSEPYMTLAAAGARRDYGVVVAQVNLKFIWDVVSQINVGKHGHAYVVDAQGRLIAHPDISLVLRNIDLSGFTQVQSARLGEPSQHDEVAIDPQGQKVLTANAQIASLKWLVFAELPLDEAYGPLYASIWRSGIVLLGALMLALIAGMYFARRMVEPIRTLRDGAALVGSGDLGQRISIKTGDEFEMLGDQFNNMATRLQDSMRHSNAKSRSAPISLNSPISQNRAFWLPPVTTSANRCTLWDCSSDSCGHKRRKASVPTSSIGSTPLSAP